MKRTILAAALLGASINVYCQAMQTDSDFLEASPERATQILNATKGTQQTEILVQTAVDSKRISLIKNCFENQYSARKVCLAVAELPDSEFKDALTMMMLSTPSSYWPREGDLIDGSFAPVKPIMDEPFLSLVKRLLPQHEMGDLAVSSRAKRIKLVKDLKAAIENKNVSLKTG